MSLILETEGLEDEGDDFHHTQELIFELVGGAEEVCVVLREAAHAGESVELAALLVAIDGAELGKTNGQVLVAAGRGLVNLAVVRAVHGLEHIFLTLLGCVDGLERVLAIFCVVT